MTHLDRVLRANETQTRSGPRTWQRQIEVCFVHDQGLRFATKAFHRLLPPAVEQPKTFAHDPDAKSQSVRAPAGRGMAGEIGWGEGWSSEIKSWDCRPATGETQAIQRTKRIEFWYNRARYRAAEVVLDNL
jgi:hypothetical protein